MKTILRYGAPLVALLATSRLALAADYPIGPCGGDQGSNYPYCTNTGLQGHSLPSLANGYLQWTGSAWAFGTPSGSFTAGTDLSGTATSQTVIGVQGHAVSSPTTGYLHWNGSAFVWDVPGSGFAAGGDLSGTATSQTVNQSSASVFSVVNGALSLGTGSASAGALRLPNSTYMRFRNAGGTADETALYLDSLNELIIGDTGQTSNTVLETGSGSFIGLYIGSGYEWQFSASQLLLPATATAYSIAQSPLTTNGGTANAFTFQCGQNETGTGTTTGGSCTLYTGSGTTAGAFTLRRGGSSGSISLTLSSAGALQLPAYSAGVLRTDSSGNVASSTVSLTTDVGATILPVANGGTNAASLTAHSLLIGEGTSTVHFATPNTASFYLRDNGAGVDPTFQPGPYSDTYTVCSYGCTGASGTTFECYAGYFFACGSGGGAGGGAGGAGSNSSTVTNGISGGGGGGGGANASCQMVACTPGQTETVTLGAGGAGGSSASAPGSNGGSTTIAETTLGTLITWIGGQGGAGGYSEVSGTSVLVYASGGAPASFGPLAQSSNSWPAPGAAGQGGPGGVAGPAASIGNPGTNISAGYGLPGGFALTNLFGGIAPFGGSPGSGGTTVGSNDSGSGGGGGGGGFAGTGGLGGTGGNGAGGTGCLSTAGCAGGNGGAATGYGAGGGAGGGGGAGSTSGGAAGTGGAGSPGAVYLIVYH